MKMEMREHLNNILYRLCLPIVLALMIWLGVQYRYQLISPFSVLLNIEGTLLLAFAISFPQGSNNKWWLYKSMNYGSTPSFSYLNFYLGLFALMSGIIIGAIK